MAPRPATIYFDHEEGIYRSRAAQGRGLLSQDPWRSVEMLLEQRPDLPPREQWKFDCDGTLYYDASEEKSNV